MASRLPLTIKPRVAFMGATHAKTAAGSDVAVFGAPHGTPYRGINNRIHEKSPDAFRLAMGLDADWLHHFDWDFEGQMFPRPDFKVVDVGNLKTTPRSGKANRQRIEEMTRHVVKANAVPIMFGGDDSVPIPFLAGFSGASPITVLQIDAHIDWRDEREKEKLGFSSTMRRASEMSHIWRIVQAGARGIGSARIEEVEAARKWGAHIVPSRLIHQNGVQSVLTQIEPESDCVICLDLDALDSSVMPAVAYPSPGGLSFLQVADLIEGVAAKARIVGFSMVEFVPGRDRDRAAAFTAGRIACHVMARVARAKP
jgi:agmatinase